MSEPEQTLLKFPCSFPVKVMGKRVDEFAQTVVAIVLKHAPDFDPATVELRPSKQGNYLGLTATINATSKKQLDALYNELSKNELVKVAL
jgi:uncharacterized protein